MGEVVERVARAMAEDGGRSYESFDAGAQRGFRSMARAAIAAMREPTDAMADKGESALVCGPLPFDEEQSPSHTWAAAKTCYRAMIDAVLQNHTLK